MSWIGWSAMGLAGLVVLTCLVLFGVSVVAVWKDKRAQRRAYAKAMQKDETL
jgi:threonine dehydrogenase-like Zn-dependent dehydrogenase